MTPQNAPSDGLGLRLARKGAGLPLDRPEIATALEYAATAHNPRAKVIDTDLGRYVAIRTQRRLLAVVTEANAYALINSIADALENHIGKEPRP